MPAIYDKNKKIIGFTKDEPAETKTSETHLGKALSDSEYKAKYGDMPMNLPSKKAPLPPPSVTPEVLFSGEVLPTQGFERMVFDSNNKLVPETPMSDEEVFMQEETADQQYDEALQTIKETSEEIVDNKQFEIIHSGKRKRRTKAEMLKATAEAAKTTPSDFQEGDPAPNPIMALIPTFGVEKETGLKVASHFQKFFDKAAEWKRIADELVVEDINDTAKMKMAKDARVGLKNYRGLGKGLVDENRAVLKAKMAPYKAEDDLWLTSGQLVETTFKAIEKIFEEKEKFAELKATKDREELAARRMAELKPFLKIIYPENNVPFNPSVFGTMTQVEFMEQFAKYKEWAAAIEKKQKEKEEEEKNKKDRDDKLIADRLAMLEGVQYNGQQATYAGRIVATKDSLLSLSDVAFKAVVEGHAKQVIVEKKIASQQRLASRIQYMVALGFTNKDGMVYLNEEPVVSEEDLELYTDEEYLPWITQYADWLKAEEAKEQAAKDAELKAAKEEADKIRNDSRKARLLDLGLGIDKSIWVYRGDQYASMHSIQKMSDAEFELAVNNFRVAIQAQDQNENLRQLEEVLQIEAAKPDLEKIDQLIADLNNFPLPSVSGPVAERLVSGTKELLGKITDWLEKKKSGI